MHMIYENRRLLKRRALSHEVKRTVAWGVVTMWHSYVSDTRQFFLIQCSSRSEKGEGVTVKAWVRQPLGEFSV